MYTRISFVASHNVYNVEISLDGKTDWMSVYTTSDSSTAYGYTLGLMAYRKVVSRLRENERTCVGCETGDASRCDCERID